MFWKHLFGFVPIFALVAMYGPTGDRKPANELSDGRVEFRPLKFAFVGWLVLVSFLLYATIDSLKHSHGKFFGLMNSAFVGFMAVAFLVSFPGKVVTSYSCLQQVFWFRRNKRILWKDIVEINTGKKNRIVTITGTDGTKIVHIRNLADRARLLVELKRHCGENLPPDFPREPIS